MTDLGIDSRDPTPIKQALESFEDDVGEDSQRAREALRRLACRSQLEEARNGDDEAAALVDLGSTTTATSTLYGAEEKAAPSAGRYSSARTRRSCAGCSTCRSRGRDLVG